MDTGLAQFWHQPTGKILKIWHGVRSRKQREINDLSRTCANLTAKISSFLNSFGDGPSKEIYVSDYLPFRFIDKNSPKYKLQQQLKPGVLKLIKASIDQRHLPPKLIKAIYQVPGLNELLED